MHEPVATPAREFRDGVAAILPAALAVIPFGLMLGAAAAQKGLSAADVALFSGLVFAGGAQFVAVELWTEPAPWAALALAVLLVNLRHVLMGASIAGKLRRFPAWVRPLAMFFLTDEGWAMSEARAVQRPLTPGYYFGIAAMLYGNWLVWTVLGTQLGALIEDPAVFGFDIAFTALFVALIAGFWRGTTTAAVVVASALAAIAAQALIPGTWYVLVGALAGVAVGALLSADDGRPEGESPIG
jgi:4-azaleucine resistance transporter AzlC